MTNSTAQETYDSRPDIQEVAEQGLREPHTHRGHPGKPVREEKDVD